MNVQFPELQPYKPVSPLLEVTTVTCRYGNLAACQAISLDVYPGEVVAIVGESGSGKSTLLRCMSGRMQPAEGSVLYRQPGSPRNEDPVDIYRIEESRLRQIMRSEWGFVHQHPMDGLRASVSAGANISERLMATGLRHYGKLRGSATDWLEKVEIDISRLDDLPATFSGGMQQRLQIARNLVTSPSLVFMDEPTGGLDVSVQARLLDLLHGLVRELGLSVVIVTHDLAVARLLSDRMLVMKSGQVVESGITDRVLDDPQHAYTQLLVSSILVS